MEFSVERERSRIKHRKRRFQTMKGDEENGNFYEGRSTGNPGLT